MGCLKLARDLKAGIICNERGPRYFSKSPDMFTLRNKEKSSCLLNYRNLLNTLGALRFSSSCEKFLVCEESPTFAEAIDGSSSDSQEQSTSSSPPGTSRRSGSFRRALRSSLLGVEVRVRLLRAPANRDRLHLLLHSLLLHSVARVVLDLEAVAEARGVVGRPAGGAAEQLQLPERSVVEAFASGHEKLREAKAPLVAACACLLFAVLPAFDGECRNASGLNIFLVERRHRRRRRRTRCRRADERQRPNAQEPGLRIRALRLGLHELHRLDGEHGVGARGVGSRDSRLVGGGNLAVGRRDGGEESAVSGGDAHERGVLHREHGGDFEDSESEQNAT